MMRPALRRLSLATHITLSVSWIGAAGSFLVLNTIALTSPNDETVRAVYLSMNLIGLYAIVPLSLAALATGLIQSSGTHWGLLRHYWVVAKLLLTTLAVYALFMHQFSAVTSAAKLVPVSSTPVVLDPRLHSLGMEILGDVSGGLFVLLVVATLAVYKPWGLTRYGRDRQPGHTLRPENDAPTPMGFRILLIAIVVLVVIFKVTLHFTGHNMHHGH
jgi:hypothetical protein